MGADPNAANGYYIELYCYGAIHGITLIVALLQLLLERFTSRQAAFKIFVHRTVAWCLLVNTFNTISAGYNVLQIIPDRAIFIPTQNVAATLFIMGGYFIYVSIAVTYRFVRKLPPVWLKRSLQIILAVNFVMLHVLAITSALVDKLWIGSIVLVWMPLCEIIIVVILNMSVQAVIKTVALSTKRHARSVKGKGRTRDRGGARDLPSQMKRLNVLRWSATVLCVLLVTFQVLMLADQGFTGDNIVPEYDNYEFQAFLPIVVWLLLLLFMWWSWLPFRLFWETKDGFFATLKNGVSQTESMSTSNTRARREGSLNSRTRAADNKQSKAPTQLQASAWARNSIEMRGSVVRPVDGEPANALTLAEQVEQAKQAAVLKVQSSASQSLGSTPEPSPRNGRDIAPNTVGSANSSTDHININSGDDQAAASDDAVLVTITSKEAPAAEPAEAAGSAPSSATKPLGHPRVMALSDAVKPDLSYDSDMELMV